MDKQKGQKQVVLIGGGGHASVLADILEQLGSTIAYISSPDTSLREALRNKAQLRDDNSIYQLDPMQYQLINGLGSLPGQTHRQEIYQRFVQEGFQFPCVISPQAYVSPYATLSPGVQVMAGAIIQPGCAIGQNSIINTGVIIDHDCIIGAHNHIAPGCTLSGCVHTGEGCHIGTGANITQGISIGQFSVIAAGTTVTKHIPEHHLAISKIKGLTLTPQE